MLKKLEKKDFGKVIALLESSNELSVFSVIDGIASGSVYVNSTVNPRAAFIQTSECNLIAGTITDIDFNQSVGEIIDFWDQITPDSKQWNDIIPQIHPDRFVRKYTRCHYVLDDANWSSKAFVLPNGYYLEPVNLEELRQGKYKNADQLLEWIDNWGNYESFCRCGVGAYIRNENTIVSWSLSDCAQKEKVAIGIHTDEDYRRKGFAQITVNEVIRLCFLKGYQLIEWLCVDCNKGSIAIAEKMGFKLQNYYDCFTPYAPIENLLDLSEAEWSEWAQHFEKAAKSEPRLMEEGIYTYIKANNPEKAKEMLMARKEAGSLEDIKLLEDSINEFIGYLHSIGMASAFSKGSE